MRHALRAGFGAALHRLPLVILLWQVNLLYGVILAGLSATALAVTLESSWYTRSLLADLDPTVFFVLFSRDAPTFKLLGAAAVVLVVLYLAGWVLLHGAVISSVCGEEDLGIRDALRAGAGVLPIFLRIGVVAAIVFVVLVGGAALAALVAMRVARHSVAPLAYEIAAGSGIVACTLAWVFCAAVHDHARLRAVGQGDSATESYAWALRFVLQGGRRAYPLGLVFLVIALATAALYQLVAMQIAADWTTGLVLSLVWGQAMLLARSLFRLWTFAAEARLQGVAGD